MILLIMMIISVFLPLFLGASIRNSRGVFIVYFFASVIVPYGFYIFTGSLNSFMASYIKEENILYGGILLWISYLLVIFSSLSFRKEKIKKIKKINLRRNRVLLLSLLAFLFYLLYILLSIYFAGSIEAAIHTAYARVRTNNSLANIRSVFLWGGVVFSTISAYALFYKKIENINAKVLILINVVIGGLVTLMDGGRAVFLMYILSLFFGYIINLKLRKFLVYIIYFSALVGFASYIMIKARYEAQEALIAAEGEIPISETLNGISYFDHFLISIEYAQNLGFTLGLNYLNALLSFVPRDIYINKAIPLSAQVRSFLYGDDSGGVPPGLFGEAYIAGGIITLLLISFLYGRILNFSAVFCNRAVHLKCPTRLAIAGILIPMLGFTLVRGGIDIGVIRVGLPIIWCYIAVKILTINIRSV